LKDHIENQNSDSSKRIKDSLNRIEDEVLKDQNNQKKKATDELLKPDLSKDLKPIDRIDTEPKLNSTKIPKNLTIDDDSLKLNSTVKED
jgi:hypothetical protein